MHNERMRPFEKEKNRIAPLNAVDGRAPKHPQSDSASETVVSRHGIAGSTPKF